jgi:hypothetical protein
MRALAFLLLCAGCSGGGTPGSMMMPADDAVTIKSDSFMVPAGGEVFACQDFANPFGGVDTDVQAFESHMAPGSHHLLLFYNDKPKDSSVYPCSGLEFSPTPYGAQQPDAMVVYPDGIGALVKGTQGFHLNMHYLNASMKDLTAQVTIIFHKAKPGSVTQHAGLFFFNNVSGIDVPAGTQETVTATCSFPSAVNLLYGVAHMHRFSTQMTATMNGQQIYQTDSWEASPLQHWDPPLQAAAGTQLTWSSTINNTGGTTLTFGESAMSNEMSIFDGQYYPADPNDPTIECER